VVAVQFGHIGLRLRERFGWIFLLLVAILGAVNIPFYEEMARKIHLPSKPGIVERMNDHSRE
jgi:hypothetical protein